MPTRRAPGLLIGGLLLTLAGAASAHDAKGGSWTTGRFEVGPRLTHLTLRDRANDATLPMGGLGLYVRYRITRRWGIEGAVDAVLSDELGERSPGEVTRVTAPATLSALYYLWPAHSTQFYLLAGFGSADHEIDYAALGETHTYTTRVGTFGFGLQFRTEHIRYDASLRFMSFARPDEKSLQVNLLDSGEVRTVDYTAHTPDRSIAGVMASFGVNWGW